MKYVDRGPALVEVPASAWATDCPAFPYQNAATDDQGCRSGFKKTRFLSLEKLNISKIPNFR